MKKLLLSLFFALGTTVVANACTSPPGPAICNQTTGLFIPTSTSIDQYGGTNGPNVIANITDPEWDWSPLNSSYTYIYTAPMSAPSGTATNLTGFTVSYSWNWHAPTDALPVSGGGTEVAVHCFVAGNDGELWFYAGASTLGFYNTVPGSNGSDSTLSCPMPALDQNGLGPSTWFNANGQSAASSTTVAQQYNEIFGDTNRMFAMGLVFGDDACTPNWGSFGGSITCWADGALAYTSAGDSHFVITGRTLN